MCYPKSETALSHIVCVVLEVHEATARPKAEVPFLSLHHLHEQPISTCLLTRRERSVHINVTFDDHCVHSEINPHRPSSSLYLHHRIYTKTEGTTCM